MSDTTPDQRTDVPTTAQRPRERLTKRLTEAGVEARRCTPAEDGEKVSYNHDARGLPTDRAGNYTVQGGDGLVVLDIDVPRDELPRWVNALPETFVVETVHDGLHHYFAVPEDARISNTKGNWGSVRYDGWYVVGPGSAVDHGEYCNDGKEGCPGTSVGEYSIKYDRPIATLTGDDLDRLAEACGANESAGGPDTSTASGTGDDAEWSSLDESTRRRIERAKDFPKWGDEFTALIEGRYADACFPGDRSKAEHRLLEILDWLFDEDMTVVRRAMTAICRLNPQTDVRDQEIRKWLDRDENYRNNELATDFQHESTYNPPTGRPYEDRPDVAANTKTGVFKAVMDLRIASTREIADHDAVDRTPRHTRRALSKYCDEDQIQWTKDGQKILYYIDPVFISADKEADLNL